MILISFFLGSDPNGIKTKAQFNSETNTYHIKGTKTWVSNALKANVFLVFSQVLSKSINIKQYTKEIF